jgi:hypothetical protein
MRTVDDKDKAVGRLRTICRLLCTTDPDTIATAFENSGGFVGDHPTEDEFLRMLDTEKERRDREFIEGLNITSLVRTELDVGTNTVSLVFNDIESARNIVNKFVSAKMETIVTPPSTHKPHCNLRITGTLGTDDDYCDCKESK